MRISDWSSDVCSSDLYYNYNQRTLLSFFDEAAEKGFNAALADRMDWGDMRMAPTDVADISGYTFLVNGKNAEQNWTGLFEPGERVRLRFINAAAMTYFDVRIPGLEMRVVQADGNNRSEEQPYEPQSLMRTSYAVCCLKKKKNNNT